MASLTDVRRPDQAVLRSRVILLLPSRVGAPEGSKHLALVHIVRTEEIRPERTQSGSDGVVPGEIMPIHVDVR
ncbi:MAG TPA: hypothetical protein VG826_29055 [Pirellulales bacterium]|nr:hypothetical protein [Pirellulales bacterium]